MPPKPDPTPLRTFTGFRFRPGDKAQIMKIIMRGFALGEHLTIADAVRIALTSFDPNTLTLAHIAALRAKDGRVLRRLRRR